MLKDPRFQGCLETPPDSINQASGCSQQEASLLFTSAPEGDSAEHLVLLGQNHGLYYRQSIFYELNQPINNTGSKGQDQKQNYKGPHDCGD